MNLDDAKIEIERAHRIGKPDTNRPKQRPTIVKLLRFKDREEILQNAKSLKGSNLFIRENRSPKDLNKGDANCGPGCSKNDAKGRSHT